MKPTMRVATENTVAARMNNAQSVIVTGFSATARTLVLDAQGARILQGLDQQGHRYHGYGEGHRGHEACEHRPEQKYAVVLLKDIAQKVRRGVDIGVDEKMKQRYGQQYPCRCNDYKQQAET